MLPVQNGDGHLSTDDIIGMHQVTQQEEKGKKNKKKKKEREKFRNVASTLGIELTAYVEACHLHKA